MELISTKNVLLSLIGSKDSIRNKIYAGTSHNFIFFLMHLKIYILNDLIWYIYFSWIAAIFSYLYNSYNKNYNSSGVMICNLACPYL